MTGTAGGSGGNGASCSNTLWKSGDAARRLWRQWMMMARQIRCSEPQCAHKPKSSSAGAKILATQPFKMCARVSAHRVRCKAPARAARWASRSTGLTKSLMEGYTTQRTVRENLEAESQALEGCWASPQKQPWFPRQKGCHPE